MTVMDAKNTLPNISPSAVHRVQGKGGWTAQRCQARRNHAGLWSGRTSGPHQRHTGQEADEAELNNSLQGQQCAIFTEYSSIIILNLYLMFSSVYNL